MFALTSVSKWLVDGNAATDIYNSDWEAAAERKQEQDFKAKAAKPDN